MSEVDHAGHAYSKVSRTNVVYTVRRSSAGMPDRLICSSRNSLLTYHSLLLVLLLLLLLLVVVTSKVCFGQSI